MLIPYENMDYLTGHIRPTDFKTQFHEVIEKRRGGMCIDMNPLFGELLTALGYRVRCCAAAICSRNEAELNFHVILLVEDCEGGRWWCDIANPFTRFFEPVPLKTEADLSVFESAFSVEKNAEGKYLLREKKKGVWTDQLRILAEDVTVEDRNDSKFSAVTEYADNAICHKEVFSLVTPQGRRSLTGSAYRESRPDGLYKYECPPELMPWAYAQFGLQKDREDTEE